MTGKFESWGRYPQVSQNAVPVKDRWSPLPQVKDKLLPRGNGRSYGDSCLNGGGTLLLTRGLDRLISFDAQSGELACEAGVTLGEILHFAVPLGWFLPVLPGTQFVTVGGAIANDIHGKNHHWMGSFGCHVRSFQLIRSDGSDTRCSADSQPSLFAATVGGLGLTGLITRATLRLRRIQSPWIVGESVRFSTLEEFFTISADAQSKYEYCVAWIDCLADPRTGTPGILTRGGHAAADGAASLAETQRRLRVPFVAPISLVNPLSLRVFNACYLRRHPRTVLGLRQSYPSFFFPLDSVLSWNRIYGPSGFLQYQCVIPHASAHEGIREILAAISAHGQGSFLAVLKEFGAAASPGLLSFPRPGVTLALDFPLRGRETFTLLDQLDRLVVATGGAIYPAKDARMRPETFRTCFPRWQEFITHIDPRFSSSWSRRVLEIL